MNGSALAIVERCSERRCRSPVALRYLDYLLCWRHWVIWSTKVDRDEWSEMRRKQYLHTFLRS